MWCGPHLLLSTNVHDIVIKIWKKGNFCGLKRSAEKHPGPFCCYEMGNIITWHLLLSITSSCEMSLADTLAHFPLRFMCQEAHSIYWETLQRQKLQEAETFFFFFCHSDRSSVIPACSLAHRITHSNSLYSVFPPPACSAVTQAESMNPASRYSTHNHCSFPVFLWVLLLIWGRMSSLWPVIVRQNLLQITQIGDFRGW